VRQCHSRGRCYERILLIKTRISASWNWRLSIQYISGQCKFANCFFAHFLTSNCSKLEKHKIFPSSAQKISLECSVTLYSLYAVLNQSPCMHSESVVVFCPLNKKLKYFLVDSTSYHRSKIRNSILFMHSHKPWQKTSCDSILGIDNWEPLLAFIVC